MKSKSKIKMGDTMPSSPPLPSLHDLPSPTSSEPPLFSSDDLLEADATHYISPRFKRKRAGPWWNSEITETTQAASKKSKLSRNFDSGVWLLSDDSEEAQEQTTKKPEAMNIVEKLFFQGLTSLVSSNATAYDFGYQQLEDEHLHHLSLLNQVIVPPPNPDLETPHERQFRTMVPSLFVDLSHNHLARFPRELLNVENINHLSLRSNAIEEIPPGIAKLRKLQVLNLDMTKIKWLPHEMLDLVLCGRFINIILSQDCPIRINVRTDIFATLYKANILGRLRHNNTTVESLVNNIWASHTLQRTQLEIACLTKCIEGWGVDFDDTKALYSHQDRPYSPVHIGNSQISYYDEFGTLIPGSPAFPQSATDDYTITVHTSRGAFDAPKTIFKPSTPVSTIPSLLASAFEKSLEFLTPTEIEAHLSQDTLLPSSIQMLISKAKENEEKIYNVWRKCAICHGRFVIPRTEWLEIWNYNGFRFLPVRGQGCSWRCVPVDPAAKQEEEK